MDSTTTESELATLTLRELRERLKSFGVEITYDYLSQLLNTGDIAAQIGVGGAANARRISPDAVPLLAEFLPLFRENRGRLPQAPAAMQNFLAARQDRGSLSVRENCRTPEPPALPCAIGELGRTLQLPALASRVSSGVRQFSRTGQDCRRARSRNCQRNHAARMFWTAPQAARLLRVSPPTLRKYIPPHFRLGSKPRGDRWVRARLLEGPPQNPPAIIS